MDLFARRYQDIMDRYGEKLVAIQIFGHEHVDTFRLIGSHTVALTTPSLSTAYPRTNPTVRLWRHNISAAGVASVVDYDQYYMDLLNSNAHHEPIFKHAYSFTKEYGLPDLTRDSFEALLTRFSSEANVGREGWTCSVSQSTAGIYVPGRSVSHADVGFGTSKQNCSLACSSTPGCEFWKWGHSTPDFTGGVAWCYLMRECGVLKPDDSGPKYTPKYAVFERNQSSGFGNGTSYARERRFFLSSTPLSIQPPCDKWCMMQDLCDKGTSGATTSNQCFTECIETNGRRFVNGTA
jgi:hypothetical protein